MKILQYGNLENKKVILIHGFQMPLECMKEYIDILKNKYCVIVPILPGHDIKTKEEFEDFDKCLKEFEDYYLKNYGDVAYAVIGFSMGGVFASYIWKSKKIFIKKLIMESSPLLKWNKLMTNIMTKQYLKLSNKTRKRNKRILKRATKTIVLENNLDSFIKLIDNMSDKTITNYISEIAKFNLPKDIDPPKTQIYYSYGGKLSEFIFRKVGKYIKNNYKNTYIRCIKKKGHCEDVIFRPKEKAQELKEMLMVK